MPKHERVNMTEEIWKTISGVPQRRVYEVSNLGNVRSISPKGKIHILKPGETKDGYYFVYVYGTLHRVNRLVAQAFLDNPNDLPCVNHKDYNRKNNTVENLEWCTRQYNCAYSSKNLRHWINSKGSTLGLKHIYTTPLGDYRVQIIRKGFKPIRKTFYSIDEAIAYRDACVKGIDNEVETYKKDRNLQGR